MTLIRLRIGARLALGFGALLALLVVIMGLGLYNMAGSNARTEGIIENEWKTAELANRMVVLTNANQQRTIEMVFADTDAQQQKVGEAILEVRKQVTATQTALEERVTTAQGKALLDKVVAVRGAYKASFDKIKSLVEANKHDEALLVMKRDRLPALAAMTGALQDLADYQAALVDQAGQDSVAAYQFNRNVMLALGAIALALGALLSYFTALHITRATGRLSATVARVSAGDYSARVQLDSNDELGELGNAFNGMLNERVASLAQKEKESEALNNSIIDIMRTVARTAHGDLTVQAPVREDITGALSDAINSMADSTARTLAKVTATSHEVRSASQHGRDTVLQTSRGMNEIRGSIQETGKRIKRLGERSQEITGIVKLIDDIAERTSVLALNANMQAAMAGEAGRGFRVVADEVQRLAERSKEATDQIAKLVGTIQSETNDTMATMDRAIGEVVKGGELADKAAEQVTHLDELGGELLESVQSFKLPETYVKESQAAVAERAANGSRRAA
jgi:methyl-accepting chemotaxis protein